MRFYKLQELCTDIIDCPHSTPEWKTEGIRVVRNFNLKNGSLDFSDGYFVDEETYQNRIKRAIPEPNDIIISREAPMGVVAIVPPGLKCCLGQRLVLLKINKEKCNPYYLLFMLMSDFVQKQFKRADATGSIVSNLCIPDLMEIVIPMVDKGQDDIAKLLETITNKILINNEINDNLEQQLKVLYDYWFTQFDFPDENVNPYYSAGGQMIWNNQIKREIPEGWTVCTLDNLCTLRNGINYDKAVVENRKYRIINVRNISSSSLLINENELDEIYLPQVQADKYCVYNRDIIIARSGIPGATRVLCKPSDSTIFCGFIICCTPNDKSLKWYLTYYLKMFEGTSATKTGGSILQNVSQDTLKSLLIIVPPNNLMSAFNSVAEKTLNTIHNILDENSHLMELRDWLLPMLMTGQATISD